MFFMGITQRKGVVMQYYDDYKKKLVSVDGVLKLFKNGDKLQAGFCANAAGGILFRLHELADKIDNLNIMLMLDNNNYPFLNMPELAGRWIIRSTFLTDPLRKAQAQGMVEYYPANISNFIRKFIRNDESIDYFLVMVSPMDKHGYFRHSLAAVCERKFISRSQKVVVQVNPNMPVVGGQTELHVSQVDYICEMPSPVFVIPDIPVTETETVIGRYVAELVNDGDTLQLGIGGIPNAVADALHEKKEIGIHTEMLTSKMADLFYSGVITNRQKQTFKDKFVATFILGSQKLYDFVDNNPAIELYDSEEIISPMAISLNDNMVSINTALQVDLTGQVCSESFGHVQYTGVGGASDTAEGATRSKNGRSIIAVRSTAKNGTISSIQPLLAPGSQISVSRNTVDYVITEYGIARLRGESVKQRVHNLISVAHPDFRGELGEKAKYYRFC
jgi:acyl-CoA hydrolase